MSRYYYDGLNDYSEAIGPRNPHPRRPIHGSRLIEAPTPAAPDPYPRTGSRGGKLQVLCWCERATVYVDPAAVCRGETVTCGLGIRCKASYLARLHRARQAAA